MAVVGRVIVVQRCRKRAVGVEYVAQRGIELVDYDKLAGRANGHVRAAHVRAAVRPRAVQVGL